MMPIAASGAVSITATFEPGTDTGGAQVDVQNAVRRVEPLLPQSVIDQGIQVEEAGAGFLLVVALTSEDGSRDATDLGDYVNRNVVGELRRISGVGSAQVFSSERALRVWLEGTPLERAEVSLFLMAVRAKRILLCSKKYEAASATARPQRASQ